MRHGRRPVDHAAAGGNDCALRADGADDRGFGIKKGPFAQSVGDILKTRAVDGFNKVVAVHKGPVQFWANALPTVVLPAPAMPISTTQGRAALGAAIRAVAAMKAP